MRHCLKRSLTPFVSGARRRVRTWRSPGPAGDEPHEVRALVGGPVVGDDGDGPDLARRRIDAVGDEGVAKEMIGLRDGGLDGADRIPGAGGAGDRCRQAQFRRMVDDGRQVPPRVVSNSVKSVCDTRLRRTDASANASRRAAASRRRSRW